MGSKRASEPRTAGRQEQDGGASDEELIVWRYLDSAYGGFSLERVQDLPLVTKDMVLAEIGRQLEELTRTELMRLYVEARENGRLKPRSTVQTRRTILPENRTRPMTLREAAKLMGYARMRAGKKAAESLRKAMDAGVTPYEKINRQQYVFDRTEFPAEVWSKLAPTGPN